MKSNVDMYMFIYIYIYLLYYIYDILIYDDVYIVYKKSRQCRIYQYVRRRPILACVHYEIEEFLHRCFWGPIVLRCLPHKVFNMYTEEQLWSCTIITCDAVGSYRFFLGVSFTVFRASPEPFSKPSLLKLLQ